MHICIFQTGEPLHIDKGDYRPMRCILLTDKLLERNYKITIISSSFFHQRKYHRSKGFKKIIINKNLTIQLIPSPGYRKHIGLTRIIDHLLLAFNLHNFLQKNKNFNPDKIFLGFPPIMTSFIMIRWAIKKKIPLILDVKDKWPELFIEAFPSFSKSTARFLLTPYFKVTKYIFRKADRITTITNGFADWIKEFINDHNDSKYFISSLTRKNINLNDKEINKSIIFWKKNNISVKEDKYFCFIGSYSNSFNFNFILKISQKINFIFPDVKFILCGSGDQYKNVCIKFKGIGNVKIMGEVNKNDAKVLVSNSLASLAPYINNINFKDHIPNKIIESLENGIPFITTLEGTLKEMIKSKNNGIFVKDKDDIDIQEIERLIKDDKYSMKLRKNALESYKELFNFDKTYDNIINKILTL